MSTRFLGAHEDELPGEVETSLGLLCVYFGLDRAYVLKTDEAGPGIELFVEWWAEGVPRLNTPIPELPVDAQRFWVRSLRAGLPVHVPDVSRDVPSGGESAMTALRGDGVQSILFVPLRARDTQVGFMGFEGRRQPCTWSDESIALMRTAGELFVGAVDRSRAEAALAAAAGELAQRNEELERSNRELEQFASIVSHDLKSPLQVVRGFVELLGRSAESNPDQASEVQTYVAAALRGAARMDRLIDDLLAYSRAGQRPAQLVPVDLDVIASEVLADSAALISETEAVVSVGPLPTVPGDSTQLRQLMQNLVTNAIKFRRVGVTPEVSVTATSADDHWIIDVADNGIGIDAEHREEIFAMFSRLHHGDRPGSGIGLAICARVVANHGGSIWAEDVAREGSLMRFTLSRRPTSSSA
jgi:signal transduction histidine kinase